jgi:hypothetical protein
MAVDPGMQYLGVALLEGENLLWYAVKTFPNARTCHQMRTQVHECLSGIVRRYEPSILAVEEPFYAQSLSSENLCKLTEDLKTWGKWKGLKVHSYYPSAVKAYFCRDQKTKESLGGGDDRALPPPEAVSEIPTLAPALLVPRLRRHWSRLHVPPKARSSLVLSPNANGPVR